MEHSPDGAPLLAATPRHLRKRRMHTEIPDTLLVPGAPPVPLKGPPPGPEDQDTGDQDTGDQDTGDQDTGDQDTGDRDTGDRDHAGPDAGDQDTATPADLEAADLDAAIQIKESQQLEREMIHRRKRRVALLAVLFVAICLPVIVLALLLG